MKPERSRRPNGSDKGIKKRNGKVYGGVLYQGGVNGKALSGNDI